MMRALILMILVLALTGCVPDAPATSTGVRQTDVRVTPQASGLSVEQENIAGRLRQDNQPGSIKHLYVISAFSGDVILYSTVKGKVTSSGKRLKPYSFSDRSSGCTDVPGHSFGCSNEIMQDDGTFGSSVDYLYWWDSKGVYHQHYISGGQIVHISTVPLRVNKVIINVEKEP